MTTVTCYYDSSIYNSYNEDVKKLLLGLAGLEPASLAKGSVRRILDKPTFQSAEIHVVAATAEVIKC